MKTIIILIILLNNIYAFDQLQWKKLIYFSNNKPEVISPYFYLSKKKNFTSYDELNATINLLKSNQYGTTTACNYPLRYTFLKSQHINIPEYNLASCKKLTIFKNTFKNNELYLAFSSEYVSVPSSAFGHIMLLFKNKETPIQISKIIHFAAITNKEDGFFLYNYKGVTGGYKGYYVLNSFFKKLYEYNTKEQRNIYIYKLNFSQKKIQTIIYALYELRKATFKYYFFNRNCASFTAKLLNLADNSSFDNKMFYLPIDTLQKYKNKIIDRKVFLSLIYKIDYLYNNLSDDDKKQFKNILHYNYIVHNNLSNNLKEILTDYYQFKFRKFHISYKNYNSVMKLQYKDTKFKSFNNNPINNRISNFEIGYLYSYDKKNSLLLSYRPLYSDLHDFNYNNIQETEFSVLNAKIKLTKNSIALNKLTLISIKSYPKRTFYYKPLSWQLYSGINKDNNDNRLKFTNKIGLGITKQYPYKINTTILWNTIGFINIQPYTGAEIYISKYLNKNIKLELNSYIDLFIHKTSYYKNNITLSIKQKDFIYSIGYTNSINNKYINLNLKYYF